MSHWPINNSLVLNNGLIRIPLTVPPNTTDPSPPQYTITAVQDPYGCALTTDSARAADRFGLSPAFAHHQSGFSKRRHVRRAGIVHVYPLNNGQTFAANLNTDLTQQAIDATQTHAQATQIPTSTQLSQIVAFELALNSAQLLDFFAGDLSRKAKEERNSCPHNRTIRESTILWVRIPRGNQFTPNVFTIYSSFQNSRNPQQASIARGEQIFNTQPLTISNVPGLTTGTQQIMGTCTTCHDTLNVGNHSFPLPLDIGTGRSLTYETDPNIFAGLQQLQMPILPVFELVCTQGPLAGNYLLHLGSGQSPDFRSMQRYRQRQRTYPARSSSACPYFHNGVAANLQQVVNFYNRRFQIGLSEQQMQDLINFLQTL